MALRSGFVSILGRPNAGKSTLLNALLGEKIAIVARKPQTTRTQIQGVLNLPDAQIVLMDTPGIHESDTLFNKRMMDLVRAAVEDRDALIYVADGSRDPGAGEEHGIAVLNRSKAPSILALNKIDRVRDKGELLPRLERYRALHDFSDYIPISALTGEGLEELKKAVAEKLPEGEPYFPPNYLTDQPERFLVAELVREKILELTSEEVPHSVAVLVEQWTETPNLTRIHASIIVEREGQKGIIIGSRGSMLKQIGTLARQEAERILGRKIFLELFVKVKPKWREDPQFLAEIDPRSMAGL
jgi:GTP-binding protein Era